MAKTDKKKNWTRGLLILALVVLSMILDRILPRRIMVSAALLMGLAALVGGILLFCAERKSREPIEDRSEAKRLRPQLRAEEKLRRVLTAVCTGVAFLSFFCLLTKATEYTFLTDELLPFWEIALIMGIAAVVLVVVKLLDSFKKTSELVGVAVISLIMAFLCTVVLCCHLNYALDFSEATECIAVIEDKEFRRHRKGPDSYKFTVSVDGEKLDLEVPSSVYSRYQEGEFYCFNRYKGAFGQEFILSE